MKTKKKVFAAYWIYLSLEFWISCCQVGNTCQKTEGARHILPPWVLDPMGHRPPILSIIGAYEYTGMYWLTDCKYFVRFSSILQEPLTIEAERMIIDSVVATKSVILWYAIDLNVGWWWRLISVKCKWRYYSPHHSIQNNEKVHYSLHIWHKLFTLISESSRLCDQNT